MCVCGVQGHGVQTWPLVHTPVSEPPSQRRETRGEPLAVGCGVGEGPQPPGAGPSQRQTWFHVSPCESLFALPLGVNFQLVIDWATRN